MSLQDKIFDVESALEGKPEAADFDAIISYIGRLERKVEEFDKIKSSLYTLRTALDLNL